MTKFLDSRAIFWNFKNAKNWAFWFVSVYVYYFHINSKNMMLVEMSGPILNELINEMKKSMLNEK